MKHPWPARAGLPPTLLRRSPESSGRRRRKGLRTSYLLNFVYGFIAPL
jgi:hypothetical protein